MKRSKLNLAYLNQDNFNLKRAKSKNAAIPFSIEPESVPQSGSENSNTPLMYGLCRYKETFFNVSCEELARNLLGQILVRRLDDGTILRGKILETECYLGGSDKGSHSFNGRRTKGNEPMFMKPGTLYVYMTYGMYHCLNISSQGDGSAVLLRSLQPLEGFDYMQNQRKNKKTRKQDYNLPSKDKKDFYPHELCNGPSKLCISLDINKENCNKQDLSTWDDLWIEPGEACDTPIPAHQIVKCARIGIDSAGLEWASKPLRFYILGNMAVSRRNKVMENELRDLGDITIK